jgi:hypothetical protein
MGRYPLPIRSDTCGTREPGIRAGFDFGASFSPAHPGIVRVRFQRLHLGYDREPYIRLFPSLRSGTLVSRREARSGCAPAKEARTACCIVNSLIACKNPSASQRSCKFPFYPLAATASGAACSSCKLQTRIGSRRCETIACAAALAPLIVVTQGVLYVTALRRIIFSSLKE